ncbi:MAG: DMT family transporter [Saprospiraceae bacterium]|jgi:drug/metabolite transporter (DMT)-like permease|nr:DMT family transporter [Saprospiraceae bacterium]MCA0333362.1 DMT family transporter [Bacteroidota bacterium]MCO5277502.1 DMT family transporter [Saprospiraceae bacterium]
MRKSYLILHIAVILAGFTGIFGKLISLNEVALVWYRVLFSTLILLLGFKILKIKRLDSLKDKIVIVQVGSLLMLHWIFFYASIKYANVSVGVICYCLTSFFTAIFAPIINKKRFNYEQLFLSLLTIVGISLIFHFDASYQLGIILGVISSSFSALYTIYNERIVLKYDSKMINYYQLGGGTILLGILMPFYYLIFPQLVYIPSLTDVVYLILFSIFCTIGLYILFAEALKNLSAFTVNLTFNLEPIYAIGLAFLIFDEAKEVNASFYWGLALVLLSVVLQAIFSLIKR